MSWLYFVLFNVASTFFPFSNTPQYTLYIDFSVHQLGFPFGNISRILAVYVPKLSKGIALGCMSFFISIFKVKLVNLTK